MMRMSFWWGSDLGDFFIRGFTVRTPAAMVAICFGLAALAIIYESMKVLKTRMRQKAARESRLPGLRNGPCQSESSQLISQRSPRRFPWPNVDCMTSLIREVSFHALDGVIGYAVMLSVMLYNGYMFIAVILGTAIGHFVFGHLSRKINMENVQARTTAVLCAPVCPDQESYSSVQVTPPLEPCGSSTGPSKRRAPTSVMIRGSADDIPAEGRY